MKQYWVAGDDGTTHGPISLSELLANIEGGQWPLNTLICEVGGEVWVEASTLSQAEQAHGDNKATGFVDLRESRGLDLLSWATYPSRLASHVVMLGRRVLSDRIAEAISRSMGWFGLASIAVGGVAALLFTLAYGFRENFWSIFAWIPVVVVIVCLLQFVAERFTRECDDAVRKARHRYSRDGVFDVLGVSLIGLGTLIVVQVVRELVDEPRSAEDLIPLAIVGLLLLLIGSNYLHPGRLGLDQVESTSLGEDGLAFLAGMLKSFMLLTRILMGLCCGVGMILMVLGSLLHLFDGDDARGIGWFAIGTFTLGYGALLPFATYLVAMLAFIPIDLLSKLLSRERDEA